ncbi:MAG: ATP-binding protein, partial [Paludibaculum sp.]
RQADLPGRVMLRLDAYHNWVSQELRRSELAPGRGQLGYRSTLNLGVGYPVHLIGLNTAWMCGDDSDAGRLWILDDQLMRLVTDEHGNSLQGLRILLMHHPFDQLADGSKCRRLIAGHVDLVLRGHLHETELETWSDPGRTIRQLAVGSLYEGWRADDWPNSCQLLSVQSDPSGKPVQVDLRFRAFSPRGGHWHDDSSLYPEVKDGRFSWRLPNPATPRKSGESNPFDPWTPATAPHFVGRSGLLSRLQDAMDEGRSVSLVGDWRIGKTSLLRMCMSRLESSGRTARLLSGEGHEGASVADFVESATGVRAENTPDAAADQLSSWAREVQKSGLPAALLVDEFDALVARFEHRFLERLRGMLDYLCMVVSSRRELDRLYKELGRTSPFHNRLELRWVGLLEPEASEQLIARSAGLLPPDAASMVQEYAGRHPFFIQLFGRKLIDSCRYGESLEEAKDQFLAEGSSRLRELWGTLSERDQKTLKAAIETPQTSAAGLRRRGLLTEDGRPFGRLLVEWLKDDN